MVHFARKTGPSQRWSLWSYQDTNIRFEPAPEDKVCEMSNALVVGDSTDGWIELLEESGGDAFHIGVRLL